MRTKTLWLAGCIALALRADAQQRPDLSGTWMATKDAPAGMTAAPSPLFGERFAFRQSVDSLTVIRPVRDSTIVQSFVLGGPEVRTRVPGALCQGDVETIEVGARDGDAVVLTIVGSIPPGGGPVMKRDVRRVFRLQSADALIVEGRMMIQGKPHQVATVYRRSTETISESNATSPPAKAAATIAQVAWIAGVWIGSDGQTTTEERWTPAAGGSMLAVSRSLRNNAMSAFEFLCITERGGTLVYSAMPNGRSPATHFTLTAVAAESATFENPAHDFPKMVRYAKRADGSLETTIGGEGGQRAQSVVLKREEK